MMPTFCDNGSVALVDVNAIVDKGKDIGAGCVFLLYKLITMIDEENNEIRANLDEVCIVANISKRLLSKHLKKLREAGIVRLTIDGIAINPEYAIRCEESYAPDMIESWKAMRPVTKTLWEF